MKFYKTTIHFQNSSSSISLHVPAILFKAWPVLRVVVLVGLVLLLVQLSTTTVYDGVLGHVLSDRSSLNKELSQIEETLDYLSGTSADFLNDEKRLHSKYGLPVPESESRELATGGALDPDSMLLRKSSPIFEKMTVLRETAGRLQGKLENNNSSFVALTRFMNQNKAMWRFVPSISPTRGRYASAFGPRIHPVTGEVGKMHQGVDIANDRWTPIFASADGMVEIAQLSSSFGNFITLNHGNGIKTRYGHMQMMLVQPGQFVHRYQIIGYMGNTGRSVGPHLHYEVWVGNNPVNPLAYMLPGDHSVD
ncbi:MAG: M23 family metallopeptidase [Fibrobacter sp.]|uniref:M23 family metallopeptidase n=1 Tax=Fibrobacter sp. TaxID=35828 RepID=UPI00388E8F0D|nr:M23 family metallopeptidase [Fibrobacter sp.]